MVVMKRKSQKKAVTDCQPDKEGTTDVMLNPFNKIQKNRSLTGTHIHKKEKKMSTVGGA